MKGYKGFDKNLKCHGGYQYEIGRTETTDKAELCKAGFHVAILYKHQAVGCVAQVILHADPGIMDYGNG